MFNRKNNSSSTKNRYSLATEYPLCEKDDQNLRMEHMRKLQKEALKLWRALKKKPK
jgi:hypothetical protein